MPTFTKTTTLPFKYNIPSYKEQFLQSKSLLQRFIKFAKRYLYLLFNGNLSLEQQSITQSHKNILWINLSAPSLGDSLMDLSSRVLLKDKNIDLFTSTKNAHIYQNDKFFNNVITDGKKIKNNYDLVIVDSYGSKSLKTKFKYLKKSKFVGNFGFYNGIEVNRVLFSFHRINHLLGYIHSEEKINSMAKSVIFIGDEDKNIVKNIKLPTKYTTIAIGGEWDYRTYQNWQKVIELILRDNPDTNIVLIGSNNATKDGENIQGKNIINLIAKYSFTQTVEIINNSSLFIGCDGGLMHGANSVNTPIIPLFARLTPQMQLTSAIKAYPLYDNENVNNIKVLDIFNNYQKAIKEVCSE
jgi:ADP-heptose:LPS heptosyltransferase